MEDIPMEAFELAELILAQQRHGTAYYEYLRHPRMSSGVYVLPAGSTDLQQPHTEDEIYVVMQGRASIRVAEEDRPVGPGSVVYVAANVAHHFHQITEDLVVLVMFAPAEYTLRAARRSASSAQI
jgi:mannose-6-phosphate isomerase-like protein (cupin superfamily)